MIWTRSAEVAHATAPVLFWYALANAVVGVLGLPFMLQFAKGRLRVHVIGNLFLTVPLVLGLILAAQRWGAVGAAKTYFAANLLFLVFWVPVAHWSVQPSLTWRWSVLDVLPTSALTLASLTLCARLFPSGLPVALSLVSMGLSVVGSAALGIAAGDLSGPDLVRRFRMSRAR